MMAENYQHFMVFSLEDTGERIKLDVSEDEFRTDNGKNFLKSDQVYVIIQEELRRIFIWNGAHSSVRKKFIASRVASDLQNELLTTAHFHRCKIISVDQGDEVGEFLNAFGFKSTEISDAEIDAPFIIDSSFKDDKAIYQWNGPPPILKSIESNLTSSKKSQSEIPQSIFELSGEQKKNLYKIVANEIPENFKRQIIILGNFNLFGAVSKKVKVFGKEVEEVDWELLKSSPKGVVRIDNHSLRLYFNDNMGKLEGIEILEPNLITKKEVKQEDVDYNKLTVKELKEFCKRHEIKVSSSYRKAQIVELVENYNKQN